MAGKGLNKVMIIGNLGKDPEVRYLPSGQAVANLNVATNEKWKDKDGNLQEKTEWHRIVLFGKQAEVAGQYLNKGSQVYIEGRLQTREWEKDGQKRYTTEIVGREMVFLGGRGDGEDRGQDRGQDSGADRPPPGDDDVPF